MSASKLLKNSRKILRKFSARIPHKDEPGILRKKNGKVVVRLENETYNDQPDIKSLVFICGLHRSGTTLLERLLSAQFELSYLRANVPESEGQHLQRVFAPAAKFGGPGKFAFSYEMRQELENQTDYESYRSQIMNQWSKFVVGNSPTLLEKSPPHLTKIWWLRKVFPNSKFIIFSRDPRAVSAATEKWSQTTLTELMLHWNAAYSCAFADFHEQDCIISRYEDLVEHPEDELARIGSFLSLKPRSEMLNIENRFSELKSTNPKYIEAHKGAIYGRGIWEKFGYNF